MLLLFNDQDVKLEYDNLNINYIINKINEKLQQSEKLLSHLVVDGIEIYTDFEIYLEEHKEYINEVRVITKSKKVFIHDTVLTLKEYLGNMEYSVSQLINNFYNNYGEAWRTLEQFLSGIEWLNQVILNIDSLKEKPTQWDEIYSLILSVNNEVEKLEGPLENQDSILIGDILQYEIKHYLELLYKKVSVIVDLEVLPHDVN